MCIYTQMYVFIHLVVYVYIYVYICTCVCNITGVCASRGASSTHTTEVQQPVSATCIQHRHRLMPFSPRRPGRS